MNRLKMTQLNIRVDVETAEIFRAFCRETGVTQNECMKWLLELAGKNRIDAPEPWAEELLARKETEKKLREEIEGLRRERAEAVRKERKKKQKLLDIYCQGSRVIAKRRCLLGLPSIVPYGRKQWDSKAYREYKWPTESGVAVVRIRVLVYGRGKHGRGPLFVLAERQGEKLKFRRYIKKEYIGISPITAVYNEEWVLGYIVSDDGAADLIFGMPLSAAVQQECQDERFKDIFGEGEELLNSPVEEERTKKQRKLSLDEIIKDASKRR